MSGRTGTRRKPRALHLVDGTLQASRHGSAADAAADARANRATRVPCPPAALKGSARAEWRRIAPLLHERGLLSTRDRAALTAYCRAWGVMIDAQKVIDAEGLFVVSAKGNRIQHPAVGVANRASVELRSYLIEFGLSPSAEARLTGGAKQDADPLAEFEREDRKQREAGRGPGAK